jgi:hypothetical protein
MAIELETGSIFTDELTTTIVVDGASVAVVAGPILQNRSEFDGALQATWQMTVQEADFVNLYLGQEKDIDGATWTVDGVNDSGLGVIELDLMRYLS